MALPPTPSSSQPDAADALTRRLARRLLRLPEPELWAARRALVAYLKANPEATPDMVIAALGPVLERAALAHINRAAALLTAELEAQP